ncbi:MAG TPA: apolipoprotein N-acyltransferase [Croceibacterium sp.]|nr:apolipoprotein N-acyltransferase [Croceibacterium sp.]
MTRAADAIESVLSRPRLLAPILGIIAATGFQPLGLWPLTLLSIGVFAVLIERAPHWRRAALLGWLFGLAHFTFANAWIATAFTYQAQMPPALGWVAVPLLSLYLAVYPALAAAGAKLVAQRGGRMALLLAFAGCWIISEWLRSWVFTGFPWNPLGVVLLGPFDRPGLAAVAPWFGTYALSGLSVLFGGGLVLAMRERRWFATAIGAALLVLGMYIPAGRAAPGHLHFTIVQPDVPQGQLDDQRFYEANFQKTAALTLPDHQGKQRLVLWPESGLPDLLREGYPQRYYDTATAFADPRLARQRIGRVIGPASLLLTGAVDLRLSNGHAVGAYNAVTAIDSAGEIVGSYDKAHLVPYGEYLALKWLLEPLGARRLVAGSLDFIPGPGPRTLDLGLWGMAGVQVCYEIVFSGQVVDRDHRPDYIFNDSNDGWFGAFGPPQHLAQARLRAIEEGLPILRATTTGISAVIDARGTVRQHLPLHRSGRLDGVIPPALAPTPFSQLGNILPLGWALLVLSLALVAMQRRAR